jgi:hypothetical protein
MTRNTSIIKASSAILLAFGVATLAAQQSAIIDATGPLRLRSKEPVAISLGGGLQPLYPPDSQPIQAEITSLSSATADGKTVYELVLRNASRKPQEIAVNPNSADFEGKAEKNGSYSAALLKISIVSTGSGGQSCVLNSDLKFFGSSAVPGSLTTLNPGESVRIKAPLRAVCTSTERQISGGGGAISLSALVSFGKEEIFTQSGELHGRDTIENFIKSNSFTVQDISDK